MSITISKSLPTEPSSTHARSAPPSSALPGSALPGSTQPRSARPDQPGRAGPRSAKRAGGNPFLPLILDVAVPLVSYYLMRHFGVPLVTALAISGLVPAIRVVWSLIRERTADGMAIAVLTLTAVSIPVAFLTGSPKLLLAKESLGTGSLGIWVMVSVLLGRPAMVSGFRAFLARTEGSAAAWEQLTLDSAAFRHCLNAATLVWGIGFVAECLARIAVVVLLPVTTAVWAVNIPIAVVTTACIIVQSRWTIPMYHLIHARVTANDAPPTPTPAAA